MAKVKKYKPGTKEHFLEEVNAEDIAATHRPFRQDLTVEFNGQTMFSLPTEILELLTTSEARQSAKLYINNGLYLSPADWTITTTYLQFTNSNFALKTDYEITLMR